MKPERWRQIEQLYNQALEMEESQRMAFLREACAGDDDLRRELKQLLAEGPQASSFLEEPALREIAHEFVVTTGQSWIGRQIGNYEFVSQIGAGGMGEVYRARDTKLKREVAIKILPEEFSRDSDRVSRFQREAQLLASLNHPNIAAIYDLEEADGIRFLILELVEGETLHERLKRGPIPLDDALQIATQIAEGLGAAHERGVIHRDLKPANIKLTPEGKVKVLDFGLAKAFEHEAADVNLSNSPTKMTASMPGTILGTAAYMPPEQARGKVVDKRADIWAFGCVLYEMLTGRAPFARDTMSDTLAAILERDPAWSALPATTPAQVQRLLFHCLDKDPRARLHDIADARIEIEDVRLDLDEAPSDAPRGHLVRGDTRRLRRLSWAAPLLVAIALLAIWTLWPRADQPLDFVSVLPPAGTSLAVGEAPQISPDGKHVVFPATDAAGRTLLYVRTQGSLAVRALPNTDDGTLPFWAPDSRQLAFFSRGSVKIISVSGGQPRTLAPAPVPRGGSWSQRGVIVFVPFPNDPPQLVSEGGGAVSSVPIPDPFDERRWFPSFLPDGRHYLYLAIDVKTRIGRAIRIASMDSTETKGLIPSTTSAVYAEPGHVLFRREGALVAQAFDARTLELQGMPRVVVENVGSSPITYQGFFSASAGGALAYLESDPGWHLTWFDRFGRREDALMQTGQYNSLCISRDGTRVVYDLADVQTANIDIWSFDLANRKPSRLTFDPSVDFYPVCGPAAHEVVFATARAGQPSIARLTISSPGGETPVRLSGGLKQPTDVSRDGRLLVYSTFSQATSWDVWVTPLSDGIKAAPFAATPAEEGNAKMSPDGRWMAYAVREKGRTDVYVQPFPATGAKWQVSPGGGSYPVWSANGRELFYLSADKKIGAVDVTDGASGFAFSSPHSLFEVRLAGWERISQGSPFAVTPDGQRFLVSSASDVVVPITLVVNWPSALNK